MELIYGKIKTILKSCEMDFPFMPLTQLFNEGWMLRLTLDRFASLHLTNQCHLPAVPPSST